METEPKQKRVTTAEMELGTNRTELRNVLASLGVTLTNE